MTRWRTETNKYPGVLTELSGWWDRQAAAQEIPFLNTAILQCWITGLMAHHERPDIQILYKDGDPVAAAPMVRSRGRLLSMMYQFGPFDLISNEAPETTEYMPRWLNSWRVAHFSKLRESSCLVKRATTQSRWMITKARSSPYVDLTPGIDVVRAQTSKEHRRAVQRRTRRLTEIGELTFVDHPPATEVPSVLGHGLELEASGWKGE